MLSETRKINGNLTVTVTVTEYTFNGLQRLLVPVYYWISVGANPIYFASRGMKYSFNSLCIPLFREIQFIQQPVRPPFFANLNLFNSLNILLFSEVDKLLAGVCYLLLRLFG